MAKQFNPTAVESSRVIVFYPSKCSMFRWYSWWEKFDFFVADSSSSKPPFVIFSEMERVYVLPIHQLQLELASARERSGSFPDESHLSQIKSKDNPQLGQNNGTQIDVNGSGTTVASYGLLSNGNSENVVINSSNQYVIGGSDNESSSGIRVRVYNKSTGQWIVPTVTKSKHCEDHSTILLNEDRVLIIR